jgi:acetylcholinesterase
MVTFILHSKQSFSYIFLAIGLANASANVLEQQVYFDNLVSATNCTDAPDRFECLRYAPYPAVQSAVDASPGLGSYQSMRLAWTPVVDGTLIPRNPMQLVESGKYAKASYGVQVLT